MALETYSYAFFLELGKRFTAPVVDKLISQLKGRYAKGELSRKIIKGAGDHLSRSFQKCSCINTIVYPGEFKKIEDIYVPLTVRSESNGFKIKVDDVVNIFDGGNKIIIKDSAGMGKTTLSKRVFLNLVAQKKYIPIFIEARNLSEASLKDQFLEMIGLSGEVVEDDIISELNFVFIIDGLDEIPYDIKAVVAKNILEFSEKFKDKKILLTSREEDVTHLFYSFVNYFVVPLAKSESLEIIQKIAKDEEIANRLIREIENKKDETIDSFLTTPLYVCLLFSVYRHRSKIPSQKNIFYANVYDALFNHHDATSKGGYYRDKYSGLDAPNFEVVLRRLAFFCLQKGQVEFTTHSLRVKVNEIIGKIDFISCGGQDYVRDLIETVPLFVKEGQSVRWSHKSLMEYFAVSFVYKDAKEKNREVLLKLFEKNYSGELYNFFDIYSREDTEGFKNSVVERILINFVEHYETYLLSVGKKISKADAGRRKALTFDTRIEFLIGDNKRESKLINFISECIGEESDIANSLKILLLDPEDGKEDENKVTIVANTNSGASINVLPIVHRINPGIFLDKYKYENSRSNRVKIINNFLPGKRYIIGESPRMLCNLEKNFAAINELLERITPYALSYRDAKKELERINKSKDSLDEWLSDFV